jgi:hypothetical protein
VLRGFGFDGLIGYVGFVGFVGLGVIISRSVFDRYSGLVC